MKPVDFDYEAATTVEEALAFACEAPQARYLAGGQSLVPLMNMRLVRPTRLIDVNGIAELARLELANGQLHIGATVRHRTLEQSPVVRATVPLLSRAAEHIGYVAVRNRGTIGGSLVHSDPTAELPLVAVAMEARVIVACRSGSRREVAAAQFFHRPFQPHLTPGELVTEVIVPAIGRRDRWRFGEISRRLNDPALAAAALGIVNGRVRVAVGGVEGVPRRLTEVEDWLSTGDRWMTIDRQTVTARVCTVLTPMLNTVHGSGPYRVQLAGNLIGQLLEELRDPDADPND
jgi:aerobic carbon-monoxide dehydrogenase medium subunit